MKTLVYSIHGFDRSFMEKAARGKHELFFEQQPLNEKTVSIAKGYEAIALFTSDQASEKVLDQLSVLGVKYIALRSAGFDHVDLQRAKSLGIKVANVPAYSPYAIAEHAVALLMTLNRKIILSQKQIQKNDFRLDNLIGYDLRGKTIGVIGTGKIGSAFATIMNGFGCKLLAYDIQKNDDLIQQTNIVYSSLEELCKKSDVISVHCPLNTSTKYLFNKNTFSIMKKGAVFINTARGGIVNTEDLINALDEGIISAAGLDVYENEKPIFFYDHSDTEIKDDLFNKLRSRQNVLITGHQAFLTNEALQGIADTTISNLSDWEKKGTSKNDL